ncbi:hypothetical protein, unlikely [Trypanosoma brucei gambiense DAL972]|uniref:Uncharacterized protein n=1 Tax=Trypanosoma brucei gambiense (strain MHOM/CI/86/DAL972) TaxID=679716 RepID=D0A675_TRYB9|nr:hypothetical protein, unlikely [Trypanosoma brucei gambiense DAL972]CBH17176.1 hypothetical protein, unlikely [Trypanosoma brucei gambiense DAL972]|eukprot:XP_011779440.1 hypothetical protein, unlikely [Trypanosoma brucei gambiense DAL972]
MFPFYGSPSRNLFNAHTHNTLPSTFFTVWFSNGTNCFSVFFAFFFLFSLHVCHSSARSPSITRLIPLLCIFVIVFSFFFCDSFNRFLCCQNFGAHVFNFLLPSFSFLFFLVLDFLSTELSPE